MSETAMVARRRIRPVLAGAVCLFCAAALAGCGGSGVAAEDSACLRSHGWKVEQLSKGFFVATRGQEELAYGSAGVPDYGGPPGTTGLPSQTRQLRFACFPDYTISWVEGGDSSTATVSLSGSR